MLVICYCLAIVKGLNLDVFCIRSRVSRVLMVFSPSKFIFGGSTVVGKIKFSFIPRSNGMFDQ